LSRVVIEGDYLKTVLTKLEEARRSVEDLIDTIEMLSDPEFQRELQGSVNEAKKGEVKEFKGLSELEREIQSE